MKAVSPLVATAILLIITVAGGVIIYNYVVNSLSSPKQYASLSITSCKMVIVNNETIINLKITNIGTASTTIREVVVIPINITKEINQTIDPGTTKSFNIFIDESLNNNTKYYVIVRYSEGETEPYQITLVK
ncbi:MAG: hypothetical protein B6U89_00100 [Desulfurococcales archaeon ex4484_58]|nr:MAG: hypothetical protein B6U89_00100 [Desulfurococcales archaeon ex4484_58]